MFDVLVYLFENCAAFQACRDADSISRQLTEAGFDDQEITDAIAWLRDLDQVTIVWVPGAFEIPVAAKRLARSKEYDAVICLGCEPPWHLIPSPPRRWGGSSGR